MAFLNPGGQSFRLAAFVGTEEGDSLWAIVRGGDSLWQFFPTRFAPMKIAQFEFSAQRYLEIWE
jgi:hypothetical protein